MFGWVGEAWIIKIREGDRSGAGSWISRCRKWCSSRRSSSIYLCWHSSASPSDVTTSLLLFFMDPPQDFLVVEVLILWGWFVWDVPWLFLWSFGWSVGRIAGGKDRWCCVCWVLMCWTVFYLSMPTATACSTPWSRICDSTDSPVVLESGSLIFATPASRRRKFFLGSIWTFLTRSASRGEGVMWIVRESISCVRSSVDFPSWERSLRVICCDWSWWAWSCLWARWADVPDRCGPFIVILGRRFRRCVGWCVWMARGRSRGSASCYNYWIDGA